MLTYAQQYSKPLNTPHVQTKTIMARKLRPDGRERLEHREPVILFSCISTVKGSVRLRLGGTDLIATIYLDANRSGTFSVNVDVLPTVTNAYQFKSKIHMLVSSILSSIIQYEQKTCSLCVPTRSLLTISILVLSDDGSTLAFACNAAVLALMSVGISLPYVPCAVTIGFVRTTETRTVVIDPSKVEEDGLSGALTVVIDVATDDVLACVHGTAIHATELRDIFLLAISCSTILGQNMFGHLRATKGSETSCSCNHTTQDSMKSSVVEIEPMPKKTGGTTTGKYLRIPEPIDAVAGIAEGEE